MKTHVCTRKRDALFENTCRPVFFGAPCVLEFAKCENVMGKSPTLHGTYAHILRAPCGVKVAEHPEIEIVQHVYDLCMCVTWPLHMCNVTHACDMCDMTHACNMCDMTHLCVYDLCICVTWLICTCATWPMHMCDMIHACVTWLITDMCDMIQCIRHDACMLHDMTHSHMWHDACMLHDVTHSHMWHDSQNSSLFAAHFSQMRPVVPDLQKCIYI